MEHRLREIICISVQGWGPKIGVASLAVQFSPNLRFLCHYFGNGFLWRLDRVLWFGAGDVYLEVLWARTWDGSQKTHARFRFRA